MRRHQAGELKLEPWLRQLRHLTPPPMGVEGGVDYTLENDGWYQLQRQRTEAFFGSYEERRRQRALERQQQASQTERAECAAALETRLSAAEVEAVSSGG